MVDCRKLEKLKKYGRLESMVAGRTTRLWIHLELLFQLQAQIFSGFHSKMRVVGNVGCSVIVEIVNLLERAEVLLRRTVTVKTPTHRQAVYLINNLHFIHVTVATLARNPPTDVGRVIEIHVIWQLMHTHPLDRLAIVSWIIRVHRLVKRRQFWAVTLDVLVTIPTGASSRNVGMTGNIHERMAIAAVQPQLIHVNFMGKRNGLRWLVTLHQCLRRCVIGKRKRHSRRCGSSADSDFERQ